jgi:hypothetical protein
LAARCKADLSYSFCEITELQWIIRIPEAELQKGFGALTDRVRHEPVAIVRIAHANHIDK